MKNLTIKNRDNKIPHGRGNSLRNKVRGWVANSDFISYDDVKLLQFGLCYFIGSKHKLILYVFFPQEYACMNVIYIIMVAV